METYTVTTDILTWLLDAPPPLRRLAGDLRPASRAQGSSPGRAAHLAAQLAQGDSSRVLGGIVASFDLVENLLGKQNGVGTGFIFHASIMAPTRVLPQEKSEENRN